MYIDLLFVGFSGRVAQLDRVLASEAKGRGFESRLVHHNDRKFSRDGMQ